MLAKPTWEASTVEKLSFLQLPINTRGFVSGFQQTRLPFNYTLQFVYVIVLLLFKKKKKRFPTCGLKINLTKRCFTGSDGGQRHSSAVCVFFLFPGGG